MGQTDGIANLLVGVIVENAFLERHNASRDALTFIET